VRAKLEGLCVRHMREKMTTAMKTVNFGGMKTEALQEDPERLLEADLLFHRAIWPFSGRPQLERILNTVMNSRGFLIARTFSSSIPFRKRLQHHQEYLNIVLHSSLSKVETEVERHFSEMHAELFEGSPAQRLIASL
jgi:DNA-binding GntR family transcriptional regulator